VYLTTLGTTEVCVALTGAGAPDACHLDDLIAQFRPSMGIVAGVAAGLKPQWRPGDVLVAQSVADSHGKDAIPGDPQLMDLAGQCGAKLAPMLITLRHLARTVPEKVRLASFGEAADMESLILMKQWSSRGIPCLALRVILDSVETPMTVDFEAAMNRHGQIKMTQVVLQLARQPRLLPDFLRIARQSRRVATILARFLDQFFEKVEARSEK
jgi:adenosylhomocysteine nucleosidase